MKKITIIKSLVTAILLSNVLLLTSCIKNRNDGAVDFSQLAPIVQILEGGLQKFGSQALVFPSTDLSDDVFFHVNYAATTVAQVDIVVNLAVDDAALAAYNAEHPSATYVKMPAALYEFTQTRVTVKAGQSYSDAIKFTVHPSLADPTISYMLCISITDAQGIKISGNFGTIYFHIIGNPLAGNYDMTGTRYNYNGSVPWTGPPAAVPPGNVGTTNYAAVITAFPESGTTVRMEMGNIPDPVGGLLAQYYISAAGNPSAFSAIQFNQGNSWDQGYSNTDRFIVGYIPPSPTQKPQFRLVTHYNNALGGAGNDRIVDQTFMHQ